MSRCIIFMHSCPMWKFWNPESGAVGGVLMGCAAGIIMGVCEFLRWVFR